MRRNAIEMLIDLELECAKPTHPKRLAKLRRKCMERRRDLLESPELLLRLAMDAICKNRRRPELSCPICLGPFVRPVVAPVSGNTYCEACLGSWLKTGHYTDPCTRDVIWPDPSVDFKAPYNRVLF